MTVRLVSKNRTRSLQLVNAVIVTHTDLVITLLIRAEGTEELDLIISAVEEEGVFISAHPGSNITVNSLKVNRPRIFYPCDVACLSEYQVLVEFKKIQEPTKADPLATSACAADEKYVPEIVCSHCGREFKNSAHYAISGGGTKVQCQNPKCQRIFRVYAASRRVYSSAKE